MTTWIRRLFYGQALQRAVVHHAAAEVCAEQYPGDSGRPSIYEEDVTKTRQEVARLATICRCSATDNRIL